MKKILHYFHKPTLTGTLIKKGGNARVRIINANSEQTLILLFMIVKQVAKSLKKDHRQLLNVLISMDKRIVRARKEEEYVARFGKKKRKSKKKK